MQNRSNRASWVWWLLPIALALPFAGGIAAAMALKGETIRELVSAAVKLVVIP